jgi:hypothetical protein
MALNSQDGYVDNQPSITVASGSNQFTQSGRRRRGGIIKRNRTAGGRANSAVPLTPYANNVSVIQPRFFRPSSARSRQFQPDTIIITRQNFANLQAQFLALKALVDKPTTVHASIEHANDGFSNRFMARPFIRRALEVPDPELLTNGRFPSFKSWENAIRLKLKVNS